MSTFRTASAKWPHAGLWQLGIALGAICAGCSSAPPPKEDQATRELGYIDRAYGVMILGHNRPPKSLEEIEGILAEFHAADMNPSPQEVLTSNRDGQPYVIILGANQGAAASTDILAYEKTGAEGNRYALLMSHEVKQVSDAEFQKARFANGHKPAAN